MLSDMVEQQGTETSVIDIKNISISMTSAQIANDVKQFSYKDIYEAVSSVATKTETVAEGTNTTAQATAVARG